MQTKQTKQAGERTTGVKYAVSLQSTHPRTTGFATLEEAKAWAQAQFQSPYGSGSRAYISGVDGRLPLIITERLKDGRTQTVGSITAAL